MRMGQRFDPWQGCKAKMGNDRRQNIRLTYIVNMVILCLYDPELS